ncbi:MAG: zinc-ribbon domain-containing protein, partial [Deltaproteobacteria bacterium]|nr:zinc-ribbon domain-containing protein [Deltaproteobacteria bacterium]
MSDTGQALVRVGCTNCGSKYSLPRERLKGRVLKIRCKSCDTIFEVRDKDSKSVSSRGLRRWFVVVKRERIGPMSAQQLQERCSRGEVTLRTYVWRQGMDKWERLKRVAELKEVSATLVKQQTPAKTREPTKERPQTQRLVRLGAGNDGAPGRKVKWAQAPTRAADLSGIAAISEVRRHHDAARDETEDEDEADAPTQVRRIDPAKLDKSGGLYEAEEETTRRAVYTDATKAALKKDAEPEEGEPEEREPEEGEPEEGEPEEESTRRVLAQPDEDVGYQEDAVTVSQLERDKKSSDGLGGFAENLNAIAATPTSNRKGVDLFGEEALAPRTTGPDIAIEPPARPGGKGRRLAQERGQNSVLFSLDHLKAEAKQSFAGARTMKPKPVDPRLRETAEEVPLAEELFIPSMEPNARRGGALRFIVGMVLGGVVIVSVLFAVNPQGMKRLLGLANDGWADDVVFPAGDGRTESKDSTVLATATARRDTASVVVDALVDAMALDGGAAGHDQTQDSGTPKRDVGSTPDRSVGKKPPAKPPRRVTTTRPRRPKKPRPAKIVKTTPKARDKV